MQFVVNGRIVRRLGNGNGLIVEGDLIAHDFANRLVITGVLVGNLLRVVTLGYFFHVAPAGLQGLDQRIGTLPLPFLTEELSGIGDGLIFRRQLLREATVSFV